MAALRLLALLSLADAFLLAPSFKPAVSARCRCLVCGDLPVSKESSLAELRAYVKSEGLDIKTSGAGRNKAAILADVIALQAVSALPDTPSLPPPSPPPPPPPVPPAAEAETQDTAAAAAEEPAEEDTAGAAPAGFEWGGTF